MTAAEEVRNEWLAAKQAYWHLAVKPEMETRKEGSWSYHFPFLALKPQGEATTTLEEDYITIRQKYMPVFTYRCFEPLVSLPVKRTYKFWPEAFCSSPFHWGRLGRASGPMVYDSTGQSKDFVELITPHGKATYGKLGVPHNWNHGFYLYQLYSSHGRVKP
jgi:hypothetical protein